MDDVRETAKKVRLYQWSEMIKECRNSGMTVRAWCKENGISEKIFYYRQRKVREALLEMKGTKLPPHIPKNEIGFAKVPGVALDNFPVKPATTINVNGVKVDVYEEASEEAIKQSIKAVISLC